MKYALWVVLMLATEYLLAQEIQREINDQVWKPFIETFNERNTTGFMAVHSKEAIRSPRDSKVVWNYDEYYEQQRKGDERGKTGDSKRELELRFSERIAGPNAAVEVGVYKTTITPQKGTPRSFYGRFHVVLRKENNVWKILVDTDSSEGGTVSEKDFLQAMPMQ